MNKQKTFIATLLLCTTLATVMHAQTLTLTPSNYNGTNISCFGAQDGSINLTITGGTPPYTIRWSNDATTEDISNLPAGFYLVEVDDADSTTDMVSTDITLTEPEELRIEILASDYIVNTRHYNISLNGACNGSITPTVTGGTTPYTYNWEPYGQTTANLTNICTGGYNLNVTDANGCATPAQQDMTEPDRDDWQMTGNANTNPATQFIGTTDNKDLVFKTNGVTRFNLKSNGDIKLDGFAGGGTEKFLFADNDGILQSHNFKIIAPQPFVYCNGNNYIDVLNAWQYDGSNFTNLFNCWQRFGFGTPNPRDIIETKSAIRITANADDNSYLRIQHDGGVARIDNFGVGDLLINYGDGVYNTGTKNVFISTGNTGNVTLGGNNYLAPDAGKNVGIGTSFLSKKLTVFGDVLLLHDDANIGLEFKLTQGSATTSPAKRGIVLNDGGNLFDFYNFGSGSSFNFISESNLVAGNNIKNMFTVKLASYNSFVGINTNNPQMPTWAGGSATTWAGTTLTDENTVLDIQGNAPTIRLYDYPYDQSSGSTDETSEIAIIASNGYDRIISDKSFVIFLDADHATHSTPDANFRIVKNADHFSGEVDLFRVNNNGYAACRGLKVTQGNFPDYVLHKEYKLRKLKEVEEYIKENQRLPEMPSAKEVSKDGLDLGEVLTLAIKKIEELTLYAIDAKKENTQLQKENAKMKKEIEEIKTKLK